MFLTGKRNKMKRKISGILFGLLFLIGFGILAYPTVSNQWNTYRQSRLISNYEQVVSDMQPEDYTKEWEAAREFDSTLVQNNIYGDVFGSDDVDMKDTDYWKVLNVAGDGVMGYLSIPKINIKLAIYHGTAEDVLQTGIGHMNGTSLPIGGESTHSVLAAHRGLPAARLFTDIDQLKQGDMFYIHVLDETMAYQVDQILDMVDKDDHETLEEALQIQEGEDQVTLFTCTPYGVNSHRLLVRGTRVPYNGEEEVESTPVDSMLRAIQNYYMLYLILGLAVTLLVILIMKFLFDRKNKKRSGKTDNMSKEG
jgi:sortase A